MRSRTFLLILIVLTAIPEAAKAAPIPDGSEFQVNTRVLLGESLELQLDAAALGDGNFVIVWGRRNCGYPYGECGAFMQQLDPYGLRIGEEVAVYDPNDGTNEKNQPSASVAASDGEFVVVWEEIADYANEVSVTGRRFSSPSTPPGPAFTVGSLPPNEYGVYPRIAGETGGKFLVVWENTPRIVGRLIDVGGALGSEFQVTDSQPFRNRWRASAFDVASTQDGSFVVVWENYYYHEVSAQRISSTGERVGEALRVHSETQGFQFAKVGVATDPHDDSFVVVWHERLHDEEQSDGVFGQRFEADGNLRGSRFAIDTGPRPFRPQLNGLDVAFMPDDGFMVVFEAYGSGGDEEDNVYGRLFRSTDTTPLGEKFRVNSFTKPRYEEFIQGDPTVAVGPDSFMVVWQTLGATEYGQNDIVGRRFCYNAPTTSQTIAGIYDATAAGGCGIDCQRDSALTAADLPCAVQRLARESS